VGCGSAHTSRNLSSTVSKTRGHSELGWSQYCGFRAIDRVPTRQEIHLWLQFLVYPRSTPLQGVFRALRAIMSGLFAATNERHTLHARKCTRPACLGIVV